jgi:hypothetical protein
MDFLFDPGEEKNTSFTPLQVSAAVAAVLDTPRGQGVRVSVTAVVVGEDREAEPCYFSCSNGNGSDSSGSDNGCNGKR